MKILYRVCKSCTDFTNGFKRFTYETFFKLRLIIINNCKEVLVKPANEVSKATLYYQC